eukprot:10355040-Ditylum_brightwellii.AAC.1
MMRSISLSDCELSSDEESIIESGQSAVRQDILGKFWEENPGRKKVLCNLLSGGSGERTHLFKRGPGVSNGWEGFDGDASNFLQKHFALSSERAKSNRSAFSSVESSNKESTCDDNEPTEKDNEKIEPELCFMEQKKIINTISNSFLVCRQCSKDRVKKLEKSLKDMLLEGLYDEIKQKIGTFSKEVMDGVSFSVRHVGCAMSFGWICNNKHKSMCKTKRRREKEGNKEMRSNKLAAYDNNVKIIVPSIVMVIGSNDISQLLTILDIPGNNFGKDSLPLVEDDVGNTI